MPIRVKSYYVGYRGGDLIRIPAGEYDENDPALHGLAGYLVDTDHAVQLKAVEVKPEPESEPEHKLALGDMTVAELRDFAEAQNIELGDARKKADIIDTIREWAQAQVREENVPAVADDA